MSNLIDIKPELSDFEKRIWYSKYYYLPFEGPRPEDNEFLDTPMNPDFATPPSAILDFIKVKESKEKVENGYCLMNDGHSYVTCTEYYPEFTVDMMVWWFDFIGRRPENAPMGIGNLRYKIWCPPDHWDHGLLDPERENSGLFVNETLDLGQGTMERIENISLRATNEEIGISTEMEKELNEAGYFCLGGTGCGHGIPGGYGINIIKPVPEGGIKWASCGWSGYRFHHGKPEVIQGIQPGTYQGMKIELAHNVCERRHLHKFLPELYARQKNQPIWKD